MAVTTILLLAVLAVLPGQTQDPQIDVAMAQQMSRREEFLQQEVSQLWQEVEQRALGKAFLHSVFYWFFWATVAALLLEFCMQKQLSSNSCLEQDNCSSKEDEVEDEDPNGAQNAARPLAWPTLSPVQELPDLSRNLKQILGDFLINQDCSEHSHAKDFPRTGMNDGTYESWRVPKNGIFYQLLVSLQPPPGHSSLLEQDTVGQHTEVL